MADVKISELTETVNVSQTTAYGVVVEAGVTKKTTPLNLKGKGWATYADSVYTSGSPLAVNNARVKLTCDGLGAATNTSFLPSGVSAFWNTTTNIITPETTGDCYDLRIQFKASPGGVSAYMDIEIDIGGAVGVITTRTLTFAKGSGVEVSFSVGLPIFCLATFVANGGTIYIDTTTDAVNVDVYDIEIFLKRDYAAE